tara:strand:+ start:1116 stop:1325 length:210 start_codon:yes stop_codon:yes gene_type:complete
MTRDLDYSISILKKVSFDPYLFKKELKKAYYLMSPQDKLDLEKWVKDFVQNKKALRSVILSNSGVFTLG